MKLSSLIVAMIVGSNANATWSKVTLAADGSEIPGLMVGTLSGNGQYVFFAKNGNLYRRDLTNDALQTIIQTQCPNPYNILDGLCSPDFLGASYDGNVVEYVIGRSGGASLNQITVGFLDISTKALQEVTTSEDGNGDAMPVLSPTGQIYAQQLDDTHVLLHDLKTGQETVLTDPVSFDWGLRFSPSGQWLTWEGGADCDDSGCDAGLRVYNMNTQQLQAYVMPHSQIFNIMKCDVLTNGSALLCFSATTPPGSESEVSALVKISLKDMSFTYVFEDLSSNGKDETGLVHRTWALSSDGHYAYYEVGNVDDKTVSIYRSDLQSGEKYVVDTLAAPNAAYGLTTTRDLFTGVISSERVFIVTNSTNLVPNDTDTHQDGYIWTP